ncbi:MAG: hypothetical protein LBG80_14790 [Bacteroidales bacterium]|jgi:hypothetical protein|nr:hypothetical protein [Bacteroidales bacterium]
MFNFFRRKNKNDKTFDICDESTWDLASDYTFVWKNDVTFLNDTNGNDVTEKEFTIFIGQAIGILRNVRSDEEISTAGLSNIIALIIDLLASGINANNVLSIINMGFENNMDFSWPIFNQTTGSNKDNFDINDQDTWKFATENALVWKGKPFNISPEKIFTELLFVKIMAMLFLSSWKAMYSRPDLRNMNISILLDGLKQDKNILDIISEISGKISKINNVEKGFSQNTAEEILTKYSNETVQEKTKFEILDIDTWEYASESEYLIWNGKNVLGKDDVPLTEKISVDLFRAMFEFLERKGDIMSSDKKLSIITNMLDRMQTVSEDPEYYIRQQKEIDAELDRKIPDGLFNARKPDTYKYAKNIPLIIDGVHIFNISQDIAGKEIKEEETEKDFVQRLTLLLKTNYNGMIWEEAVKIAKSEFQVMGVNEPHTGFPEYDDRVNEIYQSMLQNPNGRLTKKQEKEYIDDYIQRKIDECTSHETEWTYGGYNFSEAQMELVYHLTDDEKAKIGEIMEKGLSEKKRSYQIKQDLFYSLHNEVDGEFLVRLHHAKGYTKDEEGLMKDFYSGYDHFDSEEEIYKLFNESKYLEKHKKLKEGIIRDALYWFNEMKD